VRQNVTVACTCWSGMY